MNNDTGIIILAAGQGKRMGSILPKVLVPMKGKPMIEYVLDAVDAIKCPRPYVVVGFGAEMVMKTLGSRANYIHQTEQRGTGHAVETCKPILENKFKNIVVLCGDMPFVTSETIEQLIDAHRSAGAVLTMITVEVTDFEDWRAPFMIFGRIVRSPIGQIEAIVEYKDCNEDQKKIREVNPSFFCFDSKWLWANIETIDKQNAQNEYYLTDLVSIARQHGDKIEIISADPKIAIGINTVEQLQKAEALIP